MGIASFSTIILISSLSKTSGISVLPLPPVYSTTRPVDFYCEGPPQVKR